MDPSLSLLDNSQVSTLVAVSGKISGVPIPPVLTPSGAGHSVAGSAWAKVASISNADIVAMGNVATANFPICTLPAKGLIKTILIVLTDQPTGVTTLALSLGYDSGTTYADYFNAADLAATAPDTLLAFIGDLSGSPTVPFPDIPSLTVSTPIVMVLATTTGAEKLKDVLTTAFDIYFETLILP